MELPAKIVNLDGTLNEELILNKEPIYKGMNGRMVERFYLRANESYIFKPLTNDGQLGKEVWIHEHVLTLFPAIFPKILSYSISDAPERNWMILEDLGPLVHEFRVDTALGVVKWVAWWHSLPLENVGDMPRAGLKPQFQELITEIRRRKDEFLQLGPGIESELIEYIYSLLDRVIFSEKRVLSHGDLHAGNFAVVKGRIMILDWEHTHINLPYWDLYHLLDMSHPLYSKKMTAPLRDVILSAYLDQVEFEVDREAFFKEYYLFAAVFSIWMILLIQKDLQGNGGKWSAVQLHAQLEETVSSLRQCAEALWNGNVKS
ncbi:phosphotransferase [Neobacillus sp. MM2021_6]|uniref:phosphotransferase n=1 Tax=Bacillaceae TaxID=186817 RepID=UPI00140E4944|nr:MULTISPECIES: phosphotransferase [Bacillaceae]MBO0958495.1 phosphotransferase [Neobacillus sp. MM2021_6]NHC18127.1 phosphotransferase [Bacillus sp. MM2020_4]